MVENSGDIKGSLVGLAKRQLDRLAERAAFLAPVASIADVSWRLLLLIYAAGNVRTGIPSHWEKELGMPVHTMKRYLEMLQAHGFVSISGDGKQPFKIIALEPGSKTAIDELLSHEDQSGVSFPDSSDFG